MAFDIGSVIAHIKGDISDFKSKITEAKGLAGGLKSGMKALGDGFDEVRKQSSVLAVAGIGALTFAAKQSLDAFNDSEKQLAQLDAVLKSTKGAAKLTREELINMASSLQNTTTYSDEAVRLVIAVFEVNNYREVYENAKKALARPAEIKRP